MRVRLTKFSGGHSAARFDDAPCGEALRCKTNAAKKAKHRHADDGRHRMERFRHAVSEIVGVLLVRISG